MSSQPELRESYETVEDEMRGRAELAAEQKDAWEQVVKPAALILGGLVLASAAIRVLRYL